MNRKTGMAASAVTLLAVLGFALSMLLGSDFGSYVSSIFIALGFVPLVCAFASYGSEETKAVRYMALAFAAVYAVFVITVYFTQLTAVRLSDLSMQAAQLLDYQNMGLFFSLDLLGYAFMALATFFIAMTVRTGTKADKWLKALLMIHGVFAVTCFVIPVFGVFTPDMGGASGGADIGVIILESWCAYFTPVCILSFLHFSRKQDNLTEKRRTPR